MSERESIRPNLAKILRNLHFDKWLPADRVYAEQEEVYSATLVAPKFLNLRVEFRLTTIRTRGLDAKTLRVIDQQGVTVLLAAERHCSKFEKKVN